MNNSRQKSDRGGDRTIRMLVTPWWDNNEYLVNLSMVNASFILSLPIMDVLSIRVHEIGLSILGKDTRVDAARLSWSQRVVIAGD